MFLVADIAESPGINPIGPEPPEQKTLNRAMITRDLWLLAAVAAAWVVGLVVVTWWRPHRPRRVAGALAVALAGAGTVGPLLLDLGHERHYNPVRGEPIVTVPPGQSADRYPLPGELTEPYPLLGQAVVVWGWSVRPVAAHFVDAVPALPTPAPDSDLLVVRFEIEQSGEVPTQDNHYTFWARLPYGPDEAYLGQLLAAPPATPPPRGEAIELEVAFEVPRRAQQIIVRDNLGWPWMEWLLFRPGTAVPP
jgi:hypothetical protein